MDFYQEFFDEKGEPNMKGYLETTLFSIIQKAEKERYLKEIFYAVLDADHQDFEILLAYPEKIKPGDDLIYALLDQFNALANDYLMSRLVEPTEFVVETISSEEFLNKVSDHQSRVFSVGYELENAHKLQTYDWEEKYKKLIQEHPELKENS